MMYVQRIRPLCRGLRSDKHIQVYGTKSQSAAVAASENPLCMTTAGLFVMVILL